MLPPTVNRLVCLGVTHPFVAYDQIFFTVIQLLVCWYWALSLTRKRVCRLQFLLVLASAVLRFEIPPTWRARSPYLYPPGTGWPSYTPRHWVLFSSSPTTRRATVEVFESASTRCWEELIAYLPLIWHGPHTKRGLLQLFITAGKFLPIRCLATIRWYTYRHTDWCEGFIMYAIEMGSGAIIYSYVPNFIKFDSIIQSW
jgi:hypothetical protein